MKYTSVVIAFSIVFMMSFQNGTFSLKGLSLYAVDAPTVESRQKAKKYKDREDAAKLKEQRSSGCTYGRDKVTGKCYEPKEGQFYTDPKTGKVKVKKIEKVNVPWK